MKRHEFTSAERRCAVGIPSNKVHQWLVDRAVEAGGNPHDVPAIPFRMFRIRECCALTGLSVATLYRRMSDGSFPRATRLTGSRATPVTTVAPSQAA
jgi:hypothetical protein